jgi:hypothetical protein
VPEPYVIIEVNWPLDKKGRVAATGKGRPKFSTRGGFVKAYTPAKTREFENKIKEAAVAAMADRKLDVFERGSRSAGDRLYADPGEPERQKQGGCYRRRYHADHPAGF